LTPRILRFTSPTGSRSYPSLSDCTLPRLRTNRPCREPAEQREQRAFGQQLREVVKSAFAASIVTPGLRRAIMDIQPHVYVL
jgi:hypothetical protein